MHGYWKSSPSVMVCSRECYTCANMVQPLFLMQYLQNIGTASQMLAEVSVSPRNWPDGELEKNEQRVVVTRLWAYRWHGVAKYVCEWVNRIDVNHGKSKKTNIPGICYPSSEQIIAANKEHTVKAIRWSWSSPQQNQSQLCKSWIP